MTASREITCVPTCRECGAEDVTVKVSVIDGQWASRLSCGHPVDIIGKPVGVFGLVQDVTQDLLTAQGQADD